MPKSQEYFMKTVSLLSLAGNLAQELSRFKGDRD